MANEYEIFEYLEEEDEYEDTVRRKQAAKERHRRLRDQCDPFEIYTDPQFVKEYKKHFKHKPLNIADYEQSKNKIIRKKYMFYY